MLLAAAALMSCTNIAPRWTEVETPPAAAEGSDVFLRELLPETIPDIPAPSKLRPCCAFGSGIKVRLGPIPVPGVTLDNIISPSDVGVHRYDNGLATFQQQEDGLRLVQETNGLVYTCRGGFIDTAHVRDYSNLLGIKIAGKVMEHQRASSEQEYDAHVSEVLIKAIDLLGGVEADAGRRAAQYVDGVWWQSTKRLPSADLVLKRNMDTGETIAPWRISLSRWTAGLENAVEQYCGGDERPVLLTNPTHYRGRALNEFATLEFVLEESTAKRLPITLPEGGILTHNDFPRLIEAIRKKNDERYGEGASSPVR